MISIELMNQVMIVGYVVCNRTSTDGSIRKGYVYKVDSVNSLVGKNTGRHFLITVQKDNWGIKPASHLNRFFDLADTLAVKVYENFGCPTNVDDYELKQTLSGEYYVASKLNNTDDCVDSLNRAIRTGFNKNYFTNKVLPDNWAKYIKKGDYVQCVDSGHFRDKGNGWKSGKVFKVDKIESFFDESTNCWHYILFDDTKNGHVHINGVYFKHLKPLESKSLTTYLNIDEFTKKVDDIFKSPPHTKEVDFSFMEDIQVPTPKYYEAEPVLDIDIEDLTLTDLNIVYYE